MMTMKAIIISSRIVLLLQLLVWKPSAAAAAAAVLRKFAAENDPGVLNVHVVPHTHDDVGWRKTVDQYYHGWNNSIDDRGNVHDIISTVIEALTEHPARTFTYAEIKFFSTWWNDVVTSTTLHDTVRQLVATRQISFVNGGWCMHDEAASHFMGMVDQTTLGHLFLQRELGVTPKTGWQLDPFGHSYTQASLLTAAAGMDALFFGRIDYQDLALRRATSECEGYWQVQNPLNGSTSSIVVDGDDDHDDNDDHDDDTTSTTRIFWGLTGSYGGNYNSPDGFCFDVLCPEAETLVGANTTRLLERIDDLLIKLSVQANQTKGQHIMLTMGADFTYEKASIDFSNIDVMIGATMNFQAWEMVDVRTVFGPRFHRVNMFYSNPDYYVEQKRLESKTIRWPVKTDDFFPYSDCPHCFWTGYFTSRTAFKRYERVASSLLLAARQIDSLYDGLISSGKMATTTKQESPLFPLEDALGVAQHHDAISGTAKQHVADDYSFRLAFGVDQAVQHVSSILRAAMFATDDMTTSTRIDDLLVYCPLLNETKCPASESYSNSTDEALLVVGYNPLAHARSSVVRLPVTFPPATLFCINVGNSTKFQSSTIPLSGLNQSISVLTFVLENMPPLGAVVATVRVCNDGQSVPATLPTAIQRRRLNEASVAFSNGLVQATFDRSTGLLISLESSSDGTKVPVNQTWGYYTSYDSQLDDQDDSTQNSGAYIFRPSAQTLTALTPKKDGARFVNTPVGIEVHATFVEPWVKQITRVSTSQNYVEVEYEVGPVPINDGRGKEIVTRLSTSIQSNGTFYTDSNGRQFLKRARNYRPSWNLQVFEPVAGNYYPVNAAIYTQDNRASLAVVVDRSQGGSSLHDGSIELMVQRRTLADDARGVDEPMNETLGGMSPYPPYGKAERCGDGVVVTGKHRLLVGEGNTGASLARSEMDAAFAEPLILMGRVRDAREHSIRGLALFSDDVLPKNVMLLALFSVSPGTYLLRIAHQYGKDESKSLSVSVDVDLASLFPGAEVGSVTETTLSGNRKIRDIVGRSKGVEWAPGFAMRVFPITLFPMEVRTFIVGVL